MFYKILNFGHVGYVWNFSTFYCGGIVEVWNFSTLYVKKMKIYVRRKV